MTLKSQQFRKISHTEKTAMVIAFFVVVAFFPAIGTAEVVSYTFANVSYSPAITTYTQTNAGYLQSRNGFSPAVIAYSPAISTYSPASISEVQSQVSYSQSQVASVASSVSYTPVSTTFQPVSRSLAITQTASVANAVITPQLPKTGGGGKSKLASRQKIKLPVLYI